MYSSRSLQTTLKNKPCFETSETAHPAAQHHISETGIHNNYIL